MAGPSKTYHRKSSPPAPVVRTRLNTSGKPETSLEWDLYEYNHIPGQHVMNSDGVCVENPGMDPEYYAQGPEHGDGGPQINKNIITPTIPAPSQAPVLSMTSLDKNARLIVLAASVTPDTDTYEFQMKLNDGSYVTVQNESGTIWGSAELESGDVYFRVRGVNAGGGGPYSNVLQYYVPQQTTISGDLVAGTYNNYSDFVVNTTVEAGATSYQWQQSTDGGNVWNYRGSDPSTSKTFSRIPDDYEDTSTRDIWVGDNRFRVRAIGSDFHGPWSEPLVKNFDWVVDTNFPEFGQIENDMSLWTSRRERGGTTAADNPYIIFLRTYTDTYKDDAGVTQSVTYNEGDVWVADQLSGEGNGTFAAGGLVRTLDPEIPRDEPYGGGANTTSGVWEWLTANDGTGTTGKTRGYLYDFAKFVANAEPLPDELPTTLG
jgi:hypothetical protein